MNPTICFFAGAIAELRVVLQSLWTAVAKRSGDTAFAREGVERTKEDFRPHESGVALRFPPQSKSAGCSLVALRFRDEKQQVTSLNLL
jgi:hypothetical protein